MRSIESFYKANMESTKKARNTHKSVVTYIPYFVSIDCSSWIDSSDTNLSAKKKKKKNSFYDRDSPIYTLPRNLPPTLITDAVITDSIVGDGCVLDVRKTRVYIYICN